MKKSKIFLTLASAVLLVAASVMGTLAYLTSTQEVKNTFTVGKVQITLDEAKVNNNGEAVKEDGTTTTTTLSEAQRVTCLGTNGEATNTYHLLPGHTYVKDPTITVLSGSDEAYVRMLVTVTFEKKLTDNSVLALELDNIFTSEDNRTNWVRNGAPKNETKTKSVDDISENYTVITYEYRYNKTVAGKVADSNNENTMVDGDNKLPALFTGITVPNNWDNDMMDAIGGFTIDVVGQAIQADGFANADIAWNAFDQQQNPSNS